MSRSLVVDFAYAIDCTASMGRWIKQTKEDIHKVVDAITRTYPHIQFRFGCVAYRDWSNRDKRLETLQFTKNIKTFKDWVHHLRAGPANCDTAEDVLGGLQCASTLDWSSDCRVLFHICDAPPHNKMYHDGVGDKWPDGYNGNLGGPSDPHDYHKIVLRKLEDKNIRLCIAKLNTSVTKMIRVFQDYSSSIDLLVEERQLNNVSDLLGAVVEVLTDAIMRVDISSLDSYDLSELTKVETWNPLKTKKRTFQCFCGIDFGTDGTTFAIALPDGKIIWNKKFSSDLHLKDRTNILLRPDPPHKIIAFGKKATQKYTATKDKKSLYFERFKMSLYDQELSFKAPHSITDDMEDEKHPGTDGDDHDVSYLRAENGKLVPTSIVFQRALEYIKKSAMDTLKDAEVKRVMDVQWILTVPAIWSNYAKSIMHKAAFDAGIKIRGIDDHVLIATEPECASVIARQNIDLSPGTKYILLDLGGGTADIACHVAIDATTVKQIYPPEGGPWGSSYIDVEYAKLLNDIFGKALMAEFKKKSPNKWVKMKENFRAAKHKYDGKSDMNNIELDNAFVKFIDNRYGDDGDSESDSDNDDDDAEGVIGRRFIKPFRYTADRSGCISYDGNLCITPNTTVWNGLFDKVTVPLMRKVDELLGMDEMHGCKHILMVGGLSESQYIRDKISSKYRGRYKIESVSRPILAVVQGAATMGLRPSSIAQWMAPETIGIQVRRPYDETTDYMLPASQRKTYKRQIVIDCGFSPLIKKGTPIDPNAEPKIEWFKPWSGSGQKEVKIKLYSSKETDPVHTASEPEGQKTIKLPSDWKANEAFPIVYWDKGAEKKLYIAVRDWPEHQREINIQWKDPMSAM